MSFLSRLGLQSVSATEHNHGQPENLAEIVPSHEPEPEESEEERPEPIETEGAILQLDMILVLPGYEVHFLSKSKFKNVVSIYSTAIPTQNTLLAEFACDFFMGFNSTDNRKTVDNMYILLPGTHLFAEDEENHYFCEYEKI